MERETLRLTLFCPLPGVRGAVFVLPAPIVKMVEAIYEARPRADKEKSDRVVRTSRGMRTM